MAAKDRVENFVSPFRNANVSQILGTVVTILVTILGLVKAVAMVLAPDVAETIPDIPQ